MGGQKPAKGSGAKNASALQSQKQTTSSKVSSKKSAAQSKGKDEAGVACDATLEGAGFCADETTVVFCSGGNWYSLACGAVEEGAYCGVDSGLSLDCFVEDGGE